jgi:hypothetical protein
MGNNDAQPLDLKVINLAIIEFDDLATYKYVPRRVIKCNKSYDWAAAKITQKIEYNSFTRLLEEVLKADFVVEVGVVGEGKAHKKRGRLHITYRSELDGEKIYSISQTANNQIQENERYLNIYLACKNGLVKGFAHLLKFHRLESGRVALTYLQIPGKEISSYSWQGEPPIYKRIFAALPVKRK